MKKISYIIPCFNAENYISRCLESVYNQNLPLTDFEVICVNDCSPDNMIQIVEKFQKQYDNLILINHLINKGQSAARNTGLKNASGEYVWFIDSDDNIRENSVEEMLQICFENQLDQLLFGFTTQGDVAPFLSQNSTISGISYMEKWMNTFECHKYAAMYCVWTHLFRREFLIDNKIFYDENMKMMEDVIFSYQSFVVAGRVQALSEPNYINEINPNSVTRKKLKAINIYSGVFGIIDNLLDLSDQYGTESEIISENLFKLDAYAHVIDIKNYYSKMSFKEQRKYIKFINADTSKRDKIIQHFPNLPSIDKFVLRNPASLILFGYLFRIIKSVKRRISIK